MHNDIVIDKDKDKAPSMDNDNDNDNDKEKSRSMPSETGHESYGFPPHPLFPTPLDPLAPVTDHLHGGRGGLWVGRQRRILHASRLMHICTIPAFHCSRSRPLRRQTGCESGSGRSGPSFHTRRPLVLGTHRSGLYWAVCAETSGPTGVGSGSWGVSTLGGFNPPRGGGGRVVPRLSCPPVYRYL